MSFLLSEGGIDKAQGKDFRWQDVTAACTDWDDAGLKDAVILPVNTAAISGDGSRIFTSFRSVNSGRRVQPSSKSGFRLIKAGKVIDINNFYIFRSAILQFPSGIRSNNRYIHSICHLLI